MRLTRSQFPGGNLEVSHLCHEQLCVNPMHLSLEPHATNQERIHCMQQGGLVHFATRGYGSTNPCAETLEGAAGTVVTGLETTALRNKHGALFHSRRRTVSKNFDLADHP
uniref:Zinc-binding loop region of homing endonuclease domain-containing protein n=1 Tax=Magallana gigas TaxID=29159 RepID=A0A8W8MCE6_MAGGI